MAISVVIPTYRREAVLVDTIAHLLQLTPPANEIVIVDQTPRHETETEYALAAWAACGDIRWLRLAKPSIPNAMNQGIVAARGEFVLFLDDDIVPSSQLVAMHLRNFIDPTVCAVVGQILQPGQNPREGNLESRHKEGIFRDLDFPFNGTRKCSVENCMAGNLSVRRRAAIEAGGIDLNFVGVAYRFETEFCRRLIRTRGTLVFDPDASIRHLQAPHGGTRAFGDPLRSASPLHGVGDYYFALREGRSAGEILSYIRKRMVLSLGRKVYLREPWWLPVKLVGELRAVALAFRLSKGPQLLLVRPVKDGML